MSANAAIFNPTESTSAATGDGFSVPRLTTTGRLAITFTTSDKGMMVFDTTLNNLFIWTGSAWESVPASGDAGPNGAIQYNDNGVVVGSANNVWDETLKKQTISGNLDIWRGTLNQATSVGVGFETLQNTATGAAANTVIGYRAAHQLTTGTLNVGVGYLALKGATGSFIGDGNVAVGSNTGSSLTSGSYNTMVGDGSGATLTTGTANAFLGVRAGSKVTSANNNIAIGIDALNGGAGRNYTGSNNIAIGNVSMYSANDITGADNIGIGRDTFLFLSSGAENTAVGKSAGNAITSGANNTFFGSGAGQSVASSNYNTAVGSGALNLTTNANNTAIGQGAGATNILGAANIFIGKDAVAVSSGDSNQLVIGSASAYVGTNGAANTYYATAVTGTVTPPAGATGFWRVIINGTPRKIAVYAD